MNRRAWKALTGFGVPLAGAVFVTCVGDSADVGSGTTTPDAQAQQPETGTPTPPGPSDEGGTDIDSGVDPAACAARKVNEATAAFVNINGTDSAQCGSAAEPCQTVQAGINQAKVLGKTIVYVARGTYKESVALAAGVAVEGGWDTLAGKWIPACGNDLVTAAKIQMPDTSNVTLTADFTGAVTLRYLSVLPKAAMPATGESVYGIFAKGASLTLEAVSISVGAAGAGGDGATGGTGNAGATKCATGAGGTGSPGTGGDGATAGTFGPTGYTPASGAVGQSNGTVGGNGTCSATCAGAEVTICKPGTPACSAAEGCVNPLGGCGGGPGGGGAGGGGGGSSIAAFGWDATFKVNGGALIAGNGGNGGKGGDGGAGGKGGVGTTEQVLCVSCVSGNNCATVGNQTLGTGGMGGTGGAGGSGGGGAGGFSYGIYAGGTAGKIDLVAAPLYKHGTAGVAGAPNGAAGVAADHFP